MEVSCQLHAPVTLPPAKEPLIPIGIGGLVCPMNCSVLTITFRTQFSAYLMLIVVLKYLRIWEKICGLLMNVTFRRCFIKGNFLLLDGIVVDGCLVIFVSGDGP
jgi:hypothetical protein